MTVSKQGSCGLLSPLSCLPSLSSLLLFLLFYSIPAVILRKVLGGSRYLYLGTCPLKELGYLVRVFLSYAHFPFLPSTLSLTQISPSPRRHCCSHVVPIFLQENPSNPSKQLQARLVLEQLWCVSTANSFPGPSACQLIQPSGGISCPSLGVQPQEGAGQGWPSSCSASKDNPLTGQPGSSLVKVMLLVTAGAL